MRALHTWEVGGEEAITSGALQAIGVQTNKHRRRLELAELFISRGDVTEVIQKEGNGNFSQVAARLVTIQEELEGLEDIIQVEKCARERMAALSYMLLTRQAS